MSGVLLAAGMLLTTDPAAGVATGNLPVVPRPSCTADARWPGQVKPTNANYSQQSFSYRCWAGPKGDEMLP